MDLDSITLRDLDDTGRDIRAWCFHCGRGKTIDTIIWQRFEARGWPIQLSQAVKRFPCRLCRSTEHVGLFPASRAPAPHNAASLLVEGWFHGMRSKAKKRR